MPIQAPSMSEGLAGFVLGLDGSGGAFENQRQALRLASTCRRWFLPSAATLPSYVPWTVSNVEAELRIFERDRTYGDAVGGLGRCCRGWLSRLPSAAFVMCSTRREFGAAGAEGALPVAGDVLGVGQTGSQE